MWWFSCCWCYYNNNIFDIKILVDRTGMYQTERTWNFDNKIRGRRFHHLTIVFKRNIEIHACSNRTAKCKHIPQKRMQIQEDQQTSWRKWGHDNFLYGINHRHNMDMHRNLYLSSQGINSCVGKVRHSNKALYGCLSNSLKISRNVTYSWYDKPPDSKILFTHHHVKKTNYSENKPNNEDINQID